MSFSIFEIFQNLEFYLGQVFLGIPVKFLIPFVFLVFSTFDFLKKQFKSLPFLASYLFTLSPALLFSGRVASYYNYIPLVFLLIGIGVIVENILKFFVIIKSNILKRVTIVSLLVLFLFGFLGLNQKMMDNCFLIQYPWKNSFKEAYLKLFEDINKIEEEKKFSKGLKIKLIPDSDYPSEAMEDMTIKVFLNNPVLKRYTYTYNVGDKSVSVK
jgi:hypothetical protein